MMLGMPDCALQLGGSASGEGDAEEVVAAGFPGGRAHSRPEVLPAPATPRTMSTPLPELVSWRTMRAWSSESRGRASELGVDDGWAHHCDPGSQSCLGVGEEPRSRRSISRVVYTPSARRTTC